jgi:nucleoside-diphosphate kinase
MREKPSAIEPKPKAHALDNSLPRRKNTSAAGKNKNKKGMNMEKTLVIIKPDAVKRALIGKILSRIERKGLKIVGLKMTTIKENTLEQLYAHHKDKPFFQELTQFMRSAPVIAVAIEGKSAATVLRKLVGATNASEAEPGTIRGDLALSNQNNLLHASETQKTAEKELSLFFSSSDLHSFTLATEPFLYNKTEAKA